MITCRSQEQLRDASAIIKKHLSDIALIRDERMEVNSEGEDGRTSPSLLEGLDMEALMDEYLEAVIMSSPSGSGLSQMSSPLQVEWRSEASGTDTSPRLEEAEASLRTLSGWLLRLGIDESNSSDSSLEVSDCRISERRDEEYDADISSNCDNKE